MNKINSGFTLVEMMIAISIIGILSSFALPAYQTYVMKAKLVEAISTADQLKKIIIDHHDTNGVPIKRIGGYYDIKSKGGAGLPRTRSELINSSFYDVYETSPYVSDTWIEGGNVIIRLGTGSDSGLSVDVRGGFFALIAYHKDPYDISTGVSWRCTSFLIPYKYLPANCRHNLIEDVNTLRPDSN